VADSAPPHATLVETSIEAAWREAPRRGRHRQACHPTHVSRSFTTHLLASAARDRTPAHTLRQQAIAHRQGLALSVMSAWTGAHLNLGRPSVKGNLVDPRCRLAMSRFLKATALWRTRMSALAACVFAAAASVLVGCAQTDAFVPLNRAALRASKPESLLVRNWPSPPFDGAAVKFILPLDIYLLSVAIAGTMGSVDGKGIHDPAVPIRREIAEALAKRFSIKVVDHKDVNIRGRSTSGHPEGHARPADLVLDIRTTDWGIVSTRIRHYAAKYGGTLTLTDQRTGDILARATCDGRPVDDPDNPTFDELKAGGASRAKAMIRQAGEYCFQDYRKRVLGLY
jgi:hypothetical protein